MDPLHEIQRRQLRLIESASVNEACAIDLLGVLRRLTAADASTVLNMVALLQNEAEFLRRLAKDMAIRDYGMLAG
ncbi:hypothetical protein M2399_005499 [Pseudomonas sp. BIGb0450]|jgi:hypothetical protein|uniref:Uncharacterized protein n=1 Tax=Pseudomonas yamanorum TaxID=515393 RepID=A0A7Y8EI46_9PSED|nr:MULTISPECIES: hypothetical protein [Pseudomonas]MCS3420209.1 hypothetical protein [Pseudomonas sp. BIGb0558]MCS3440037.1 hypothetical protein [Pseudomonas sp. BIGb0450]NVZ86059.1 hypothetical protein [Pseudomonas yamanorum]NWE15026.1 hypothetical protein [Pseudomonas yamanorum]